MSTFTDTEELAIPLVRVVSHHHDIEARSPVKVAALVGAGAGALALALVHGLDPDGLTAIFQRGSVARAVPFAAVVGLAYASAMVAGAAGGAAFGYVTRFLRKWPALAVWGTVFFAALMLVIVSASASYHGGVRHDLAGPMVAAGALYGLLLSFSLPFRRRS